MKIKEIYTTYEDGFLCPITKESILDSDQVRATSALVYTYFYSEAHNFQDVNKNFQKVLDLLGVEDDYLSIDQYDKLLKKDLSILSIDTSHYVVHRVILENDDVIDFCIDMGLKINND